MLRRWIKSVVWCALLSVVTTVVISWSCAFWINPLDQSGAQQVGPAGVGLGWQDGADASHALWTISVFNRDGATLVESSWTDPERSAWAKFYANAGGYATLGPADAHVPSWAPDLRPPAQATTQNEEHARARYAFGWPRLAMWWGRDRDTVNNRWQPREYVRAVRLPSGTRTLPGWSEPTTYARALPLGIIWAGFGINTGATFCVLMAVATMYLLIRYNRSWQRRQRGACVKCGYPIGESPVCTECGADVSDQQREMAITQARG